MHFGVPTIFIPLERPLDDQFARAKNLADQGAADLCQAMDDADLDKKLTKLQNPEHRESLAQKAANALPENGATNAATTLIDVAR